MFQFEYTEFNIPIYHKNIFMHQIFVMMLFYIIVNNIRYLNSSHIVSESRYKIGCALGVMEILSTLNTRGTYIQHKNTILCVHYLINVPQLSKVQGEYSIKSVFFFKSKVMLKKYVIKNRWYK